MSRRSLLVLLDGQVAGHVFQKEDGTLAFEYDHGYNGLPLSPNIPVSNRTFRDGTVRPFLWGLLPEDLLTRQRVARRAGVSANNPLGLLGEIGLDCPGAVQLVDEERLGDALSRREHLKPVSEADIATRLRSGRAPGASWIADGEHWSIGGQQSKFALRREGDTWFECLGAAATTHIVKGGVANLRAQVLNEHVCMKLGASLGIPTASTEYLVFEDEPAIVVERYDRTRVPNGVKRLHQVDLCQALGCLPENKYTENGGPSTVDILKALSTTGKNADLNVGRFLQMLFFGYLVAATDGHAKNYSLLLYADGNHLLAPMYDVASYFPYASVEPRKAIKLAMSIGSENRVGRISPNRLEKLAEQAHLNRHGISADSCARLLAYYARTVPEKLAEVFDELERKRGLAAVSELRARMEPAVAANCEHATRVLG